MRGRLAHLADAARRGLELEREHCLDRVDDHERRPEARDLLEDPLEACLREQVERRIGHTKSFTARLHLVLRFLARAVEDRTNRTGHVGGSLQQQCRLADARFTAKQHERSRHDAAAKHTIELADAGRETRVMLDSDVRIALRGTGRAAERISMPGCATRSSRLDGAFLDERVPRPAVGTLAEPLGRL
ncbi:MAG: hypothetical protein QM736_02395 [Vicinamibacterales bacterium]